MGLCPLCQRPVSSQKYYGCFLPPGGRFLTPVVNGKRVRRMRRETDSVSRVSWVMDSDMTISGLWVEDFFGPRTVLFDQPIHAKDGDEVKTQLHITRKWDSKKMKASAKATVWKRLVDDDV